jgi:hypothetical protein
MGVAVSKTTLKSILILSKNRRCDSDWDPYRSAYKYKWQQEILVFVVVLHAILEKDGSRFDVKEVVYIQSR